MCKACNRRGFSSVVANTCTKSIQKQIKSIDVDKVGSKKPLESKPWLFLVELIVSSFLNLISKQVRPECLCKHILVDNYYYRLLNNNLKGQITYLKRQENYIILFFVIKWQKSFKHDILITKEKQK